MKTRFAQLLNTCGLSQKGAARLLGVRYDTVKNWYYGRCSVPDGVMSDLESYSEAAMNIFKGDEDAVD